MKKFAIALAVLWLAGCGANNDSGDLVLLNVSYDPTRELYKEVDAAFAQHWQETHHQRVQIRASHGGSGRQARAVIDGLQADVVTLALAGDIDSIAEQGKLLPTNWQQRLPQNSAPYVSTIVFLVRKNNPKQIHDWGDLVRDGVQVITPNPKTSGGARWNYLAAWAWAERQPGGSEATARDFVQKLYQHVPVLDTGARGATNTFVQRGIGDVLLAWENEALLANKDIGSDQFDVVVPPLTILAEPPVAIVDKVADKHGTREVAKAYLDFLYTPQGQDIAAKHYYRPRDAAAAKKYAANFPAVQTFTIDDVFGGWKAAQAKHFVDGGVFDSFTVGSATK